MIQINRSSLRLLSKLRSHTGRRRLIVYFIALAIFLLVQALLAQSDIPDQPYWMRNAVRPTSSADTVQISHAVTNQSTPSAQERIAENVLVTRVIDGDTFDIEGGRRVRLIGINTKERFKSGGPECFATEAYEALKSRIEGKEVLLTKDVSEVDKYKRLLRYMYIDNVFINEWLVAEGYAQVSTFPPDVANQQLFLAAQKMAKTEKKGLWGDVCKGR